MLSDLVWIQWGSVNLANILKMPVTGAHLSLLNNESQVPKFPMPNVPEYPINLSALVPQVPESQSALSASITGAS